jgi:hypothetical protein
MSLAILLYVQKIFSLENFSACLSNSSVSRSISAQGGSRLNPISTWTLKKGRAEKILGLSVGLAGFL